MQAWALPQKTLRQSETWMLLEQCIITENLMVKKAM